MENMKKSILCLIFYAGVLIGADNKDGLTSSSSSSSYADSSSEQTANAEAVLKNRSPIEEQAADPAYDLPTTPFNKEGTSASSMPYYTPDSAHDNEQDVKQIPNPPKVQSPITYSEWFDFTSQLAHEKRLLLQESHLLAQSMSKHHNDQKFIKKFFIDSLNTVNNNFLASAANTAGQLATVATFKYLFPNEDDARAKNIADLNIRRAQNDETEREERIGMSKEVRLSLTILRELSGIAAHRELTQEEQRRMNVAEVTLAFLHGSK